MLDCGTGSSYVPSPCPSSRRHPRLRHGCRLLNRVMPELTQPPGSLPSVCRRVAQIPCRNGLRNPSPTHASSRSLDGFDPHRYPFRHPALPSPATPVSRHFTNWQVVTQLPLSHISPDPSLLSRGRPPQNGLNASTQTTPSRGETAHQSHSRACVTAPLSLSLSLSPALSRTLPFHVLNDPVPALFDAPLTFARDALPSTRLALLARPTLCSIRRDDPRRTHLPPSAASCLSLLFPPPSCDAHALRSHLVDIAGGSSQQPRLGGQIKVPCCRRLG